MSDKMKKTAIIVLKNANDLSYHPPTYLHYPLVCLLCVCSDINMIIEYTKLNRRAEENRGSSTHRPIKSTSNKPLVTDIILLYP